LHEPRYRAVLFDLDGTLIDSEEDLMASVKHGLRQVEGRRLPPDDVIIMEVGKPLEVMLGNLGYPSDDATTAYFAASYREYYANYFTDHTRLFPPVKEVLTFLGEAGTKLALLTTKHHSQAELTVEGLDCAAASPMSMAGGKDSDTNPILNRSVLHLGN
jgi:phosphoglycolate phosphatase-like HAD superfamily hydrolase